MLMGGPRVITFGQPERHVVDPQEHARLIAAMADGLYTVDRQRQITFWNPSAESITGYPAGTTTGRWCGDGLLNHVDETGASMCGTACPLAATMDDGVRRTARAFLHHQDGHLVPVRIAAAPLYDDAGEIVGAVETFSEDLEMVAVRERLRHAEMTARVDPLTGLGNRRHLTDALERRFADWERDERAFGALMIDIDRFKIVNDTHGHDVGDAVLKTVARSLAGALRSGDVACRFGGEEFVVVTGRATPTGLQALAGRLLMVVRNSRFAAPDGAPISVSTSIGGAIVTGTDDQESLLRRADQLLLEAKREGRDRALIA